MGKPETLEEAKARIAAEDKLKKEADAAAEKIMNMSEADVAKEQKADEAQTQEKAVADILFLGDGDKVDNRAEHREKAEVAYDKLRNITISYPQTTPNEHTVFGYGDIRIQLGDLRALFGLPS